VSGVVKYWSFFLVVARQLHQLLCCDVVMWSQDTGPKNGRDIKSTSSKKPKTYCLHNILRIYLPSGPLPMLLFSPKWVFVSVDREESSCG
jgi:hypothetical protein